jgi:hypothetical protein
MIKNQITVEFSEYQVKFNKEDRCFDDGNLIGNLFVIRLEYNHVIKSCLMATDMIGFCHRRLAHASATENEQNGKIL